MAQGTAREMVKTFQQCLQTYCRLNFGLWAGRAANIAGLQVTAWGKYQGVVVQSEKSQVFMET